MVEGWSVKGSGFFPPFSYWWFCLAESTILVADILIFMYIVPNFRREIADKAQGKIELTIGNIMDSSYALFCYTDLHKKERGKKKGGN